MKKFQDCRIGCTFQDRRIVVSWNRTVLCFLEIWQRAHAVVFFRFFRYWVLLVRRGFFLCGAKIRGYERRSEDYRIL